MSRGRDRRRRWERAARARGFVPAEIGVPCPPGWVRDDVCNGWAGPHHQHVDEIARRVAEVIAPISRVFDEAVVSVVEFRKSLQEALAAAKADVQDARDILRGAS